MTICFRIGGQEHCYEIPTLEIPLQHFKVGPGPVNYPALLHDVTLLASLQAAADKVSDAKVREGVHGGIKTALQALQKRGGEHVIINPAQAKSA